MKIIDAIFCEDIRFELNNKLSIMGLYSDQLVFNFNQAASSEIKWPVKTNLALLLRFKIDKAEQQPDAFNFDYFFKDKSFLNIKGEIKIEANQNTINIALSTPQIPLEPGFLGFRINLFGKNNCLFSHKCKEALEVVTTRL